MDALVFVCELKPKEKSDHDGVKGALGEVLVANANADVAQKVIAEFFDQQGWMVTRVTEEGTISESNLRSFRGSVTQQYHRAMEEGVAGSIFSWWREPGLVASLA